AASGCATARLDFPDMRSSSARKPLHAAMLRLVVALVAAVPLLWMDRAAWYLAENTLLFAGLVCALAVPLGTLLAVLVFRCDLPGRRLARWLLVMQLFIPLHVQVAAWNAGFGVSGWFTGGM